MSTEPKGDGDLEKRRRRVWVWQYPDVRMTDGLVHGGCKPPARKIKDRLDTMQNPPETQELVAADSSGKQSEKLN